MKILNRYIARSLLVNTLIALGVLTFVMVSGNLFKIFDLMARGVSPLLFGKFMLLVIPEMLRYTIPLSMLTGTVLLFSRLSADNEITALKASGVSLWQLISPGLLLAAVFSVLCFWLATSLAPRCRMEAYLLMKSEVIRNPLALLEPGRFASDIPGYRIRIGERDGDLLGDIHLLVLDRKTGRLASTITARRGKVRLREEEQALELELEDATIANHTPETDAGQEAAAGRVAMQRIVLALPYGARFDARPLTMKLKFLGFRDILTRIHLDAAEGRNVTPHYVDLHKRMAMALSPISFFLIGIPFAIQSRRSETSVGLLVSLLLAFGFYAFLVLTDSLDQQTALHPEFLVWLPNVLYQGGGLWALGKVENL
ncbi:MAG: LptF/LptG family permease [Lentisphaeria bacterium]|jgi:LPS export ABC transporter permease LptF|nr:LptF/LptG family permease [Lentisphaeria bacterium]